MRMIISASIFLAKDGSAVHSVSDVACPPDGSGVLISYCNLLCYKFFLRVYCVLS